jgi:hypothetical protein
MYRTVLLTALAFGCSNNALPTESGTNGATTAGTNGSTTAGTNGSTTAGTNGSTTAGTTGSTTSGTTGMTTGGTTGTSTGGTTGGPPGAMCKTACDCMTGLACFQNTCQPTQMFQLFCCTSMDCPSGQVCQSADGSFGTCGGGTTGGPNSCKTACDCPSGEACFNGGCVMPPMGPLYCCDMCPSGGGFCQASDGSFGQCGGGSTTGTTGGSTGGTMCGAVMCMGDMDCVNAGCFAGCSMRRHVCR